MNKKLKLSLVWGVVALLSFTAQASDLGRVVDSTPTYNTRTIYTYQDVCHTERVRVQTRNNSYTAPIAGALLGGVIGNQLGKGTGKDILTLGGAVLGGSIGNDVKSRQNESYELVERCTTQRSPKRETYISGYNVSYTFAGKIRYFNSHRPYRKGETVILSVRVGNN